MCQLTAWKSQETATSFDIVATGTHPIKISTSANPSFLWLSTSCGTGDISAPLSPSIRQWNYACKLEVHGNGLLLVPDGATFSTAVVLARECTQPECLLAPQNFNDRQLDVNITVMSRPSCAKSSVAWPSSRRMTTGDTTPIFEHNDDLHATVSAIDIGHLDVNYSLASLRWMYEYGGTVSAPEGLVRSESEPSKYSARLATNDAIAKPGRYKVSILLEDGWDEISNSVSSCVLGTFRFEIECADGSAVDPSGRCSDNGQDVCDKSIAYATFESVRSERTTADYQSSTVNDTSVISAISSVGDQNMKIRFVPLQGIMEASASAGQQLNRTGAYRVQLATSYSNVSRECVLVSDSPHSEH
jgi:hypothetical protein